MSKTDADKMCASSPCVTVAVRAEPHGPVFVGDSETVKRVRSHHQEEVKHLKERIQAKEKEVSIHVCYKRVKDAQMCTEKINPAPTCSLILEAIAEQYLLL